MELEAKARHLPFLTAKARVKSRFGITMDTDDFIEKGYYIWRSIGNIATATERLEYKVPESLVVKLPQDCEFIESVVLVDTYDVDRVSGPTKHDSAGARNEIVPDKSMVSMEANVASSKHYAYGVPVNYETGDGFIKITSDNMVGHTIVVVFRTITVDKDGLPLLNDKEVEAIAANVALQQAEQDLFLRKPGSDKLLAYIKPEAERLLVAAKSPEKISDDALDRMLDIKTSWDRKSYGTRFNWNK